MNNILNKVLIISLVAIFLFSYLVSPVSSLNNSLSNDIYVSPEGNDDGDGTLQNPLKTLNKSISLVNSGGTIHVANGVYKGPLNRNISIDKTIKIICDKNVQVGTNAQIDAESINQIFIIQNGINCTLDHLTLSNGMSTDANSNGGGALVSYNSNLVITNCNFTGNYANNFGGAITSYGNLTIENTVFTLNSVGKGNEVGFGGAICAFSTSGNVNIKNTTFISNRANYGGGAVYNFGHLNITSSEFISNIAGNDVYGGGGAIVNSNDTVTFIGDSTFSKNVAKRGAGAILNTGTLNVFDSILNDNKADYFGGAIVNSKAIIITNVKASNNSADYGGFIDNGANQESSITCTVTGGGFSGNHANVSGGAFYNTNRSTIKIDKSAFIGNRAEDCGGGIFNKGTMSLQSGWIQGNRAYMQSGGGIENRGIMTITGSTILNNEGCYGGGVNNYRTMTLENSMIKENTACIEGGGLSNNGNINITGSNITQNSVNTNSDSPGYGGGIGNNGNMTLQNSMIVENVADIGGGIYNYKDDYSQGILRILDSIINNNIARGNGGGIENNAVAYANNTTINDNIPDNVHGNPIQTIISKLSKDLVRK